jgi:hypothetical protein
MSTGIGGAVEGQERVYALDALWVVARRWNRISWHSPE